VASVSIRAAAVALAVAAVLGGCSGSAPTGVQLTPGVTAGSSAHVLGDPLKDKLAKVLTRGTVTMSVDPAYPPQSFAVVGAKRAASTKCDPNQLTAPEVDGYDMDTSKAVAAALGVEPCFIAPSWTQITSGHWDDRWDISFGSGGINADRMTRLYMTQPYYADMQRYFVATDSPYHLASDLDGKKIGACADCSHEAYLLGTLVVPGVDLPPRPKDIQLVTYETEVPGLQALADGKIDAFLLGETVGHQGIEQGLAIRALDDGAFPLYSTAFLDRSSSLDVTAFLDRVNQTIRELQADGTLKTWSEKYFGGDYATKAAQFDLASIGQAVP